MNTQQNTFGVLFFVRKNKINKEGKVPIYARITVNGKRSDRGLYVLAVGVQ